MSTDSDFANELLQRVKAAAGIPLVEHASQHRASLTDRDVEQIKGSDLNPAARRFIEMMCKATADGLIKAMAESFAAQAERTRELEQQVGLLQNALAQSGQKFVLPADEHQPLSFTTTRRA